jgi:hypothetical protein
MLFEEQNVTARPTAPNWRDIKIIFRQQLPCTSAHLLNYPITDLLRVCGCCECVFAAHDNFVRTLFKIEENKSESAFSRKLLMVLL